jgi:hypothetical protein
MTSFQGANIQENFVNEKSFVGFFAPIILLLAHREAKKVTDG